MWPLPNYQRVFVRRLADRNNAFLYLTENLNGLEEERSEERAADAKKPAEVPSEEAPLKKRKKKRKLAGTTESPGSS